MEISTSYICPACDARNLILTENSVSLTLYCPHCGTHSSMSKRIAIKDYVDYENHVFKWREIMNRMYASMVAADQGN